MSKESKDDTKAKYFELVFGVAFILIGISLIYISVYNLIHYQMHWVRAMSWIILTISGIISILTGKIWLMSFYREVKNNK